MALGDYRERVFQPQDSYTQVELTVTDTADTGFNSRLIRFLEFAQFPRIPHSSDAMNKTHWF